MGTFFIVNAVHTQCMATLDQAITEGLIAKTSTLIAGDVAGHTYTRVCHPSHDADVSVTRILPPIQNLVLQEVLAG